MESSAVRTFVDLGRVMAFGGGVGLMVAVVVVVVAVVVGGEWHRTRIAEKPQASKTDSLPSGGGGARV